MRSIIMFLILWAGALQTRVMAAPFEPEVEREWNFHDVGKFRGTLVKIENGKAVIRMPDGIVRSFWAGQAEASSGSYLQRYVCNLPRNPARPHPIAGTDPLISLRAAGLTPGALHQWNNTGRLGGTFQAMNQPPTVERVDGVPAVHFAHSPWLLPLTFQTMASDFYVPDSLASNGSLTVIAWLNNSGPPVDRETFFCWGQKDCGELDTPDFSYGCYEALQWYDEKVVIPAARFPKLSQWHQFAFVVTPATAKNRQALTLYVDGAPVLHQIVKRPPAKLQTDNLAFLGCAWEAWWGHTWATRPARPFTGSIAALQVYDRALPVQEIIAQDAKLGLNVLTSRFHAPVPAAVADATTPANGATDVPTTLVRMAWTAQPDASSQRLFFGTDRSAVEAKSVAPVQLKRDVEQVYLPIDLKLAKLQPNTTYYWRVESVGEGKSSLSSPVWSFGTSRFDLEFDGPVSEPFPADVPQDGFYERMMDVDGYPIISPPGNMDIHLRAARHALLKLLGKRPDLRLALRSSNAACHLASLLHRGWGWSGFTCSCYGEGEAILRQSAILMHEMGHQFHMQGAEAMEPDFRRRLADIFNAGRRQGRWIGDYGGTNMWENVAVCASWWINDSTEDEGDVRPRELLRRSDPDIYRLLSQYWPGDTLVDLSATSGLSVNANGTVNAWTNRAGIEYFLPNAGWRRYARTMGQFASGGAVPMQSAPRQTTTAGVTAVEFNGGRGLSWDRKTWDALDTNRSWSVDAWVYLPGDAKGPQPVVRWAEGAVAVRLCAGSLAFETGSMRLGWRHPPSPNQWHQFAWVFSSDQSADGRGILRQYVDGAIDSATPLRLNLPASTVITVGDGLRGGVARLRVYDYDLYPLGVAATFARESAAFRRENVPVDGRLLVDCDARLLAPMDDADTWPTYPKALNKPWLRSWANEGTLGGKLHNDAGSSSAPIAGIVHGSNAITFDGKSRLISAFAVPVLDSCSVEAWVYPQAAEAQDVLLQWDGKAVSSAFLQPGRWQHVAVNIDPTGVTAWVDGVPVRYTSGLTHAESTGRLIIGSGWTKSGWTSGFRGHLAMIRVQSGRPTPQEIAAGMSASALMRAGMPDPAEGSTIVAERRPALGWSVATNPSSMQGDVYFGTSRAEIAAANQSSRMFVGTHVPGEWKPPLQPGTTYFWRVHARGPNGTIRPGQVWTFCTAQGLLVDVDAAKLPLGPLALWPNAGRAGGAFMSPDSTPLRRPRQTLCDGESAINFSGKKWLVSSFPLPSSLEGQASFSVAIKAYFTSPQGLDADQTMLSWGSDHDRVEYCWGFNANTGAFRSSKLSCGFQGTVQRPDRLEHNAPLPDGWRSIVYVYDAPSATLRIYVDGKLNRQSPLRLQIKGSTRLCIGGALSGKSLDHAFAGSIREVAVVGAALDEKIVAAVASQPASQVLKNCLVLLQPEQAAPGPVEAWTNRGALGGAFRVEAADRVPALVQTIAGRAAVSFEGRSCVISNMATPKALVGNHPFTVEAWLFVTKPPAVQTVFALAPSVAMEGFPNDANTCAANLNFGIGTAQNRQNVPGAFATGQSSHNVGWNPAHLPRSGAWQHVAWVHSDRDEGALRVYVDGNISIDRGAFALDTIAGRPMVIGAGWNTETGIATPFRGAINQIRIYDYERTAQEIQLDATDHASH